MSLRLQHISISSFRPLPLVSRMQRHLANTCSSYRRLDLLNCHHYSVYSATNLGISYIPRVHNPDYLSFLVMIHRGFAVKPQLLEPNI